MASLYDRDDSKEFWLACYPQPGSRLVRASTATADRHEAERILQKVELLIALERLKDVPVPEKIMARLEGLPRLTNSEPEPKKQKLQNLPLNPYAPNPALELPGYKGTGSPIVVLSEEDVASQYTAVASEPKILFGCQVMIEGGFRLHEALALRRASIAEDFSYIQLLLPQPTSTRSTKLKTGERPVTVRSELECHIRSYLPTIQTDWLIASPSGQRWNSNAFADRLREFNRKAKLPWTTQDFRHTFATNRVSALRAEGRNTSAE